MPRRGQPGFGLPTDPPGPEKDRARESRRVGSSSFTPLSIEGLQACLCPPENERMHVVGAFVGIHRFEIYHVAHHLKLFRDAVGAVHIPRHTRDAQAVTQQPLKLG